MIQFYRRHSSPLVTKWMAHILHHSIHFGFVKVLTETIKKETAIYPRRSFGESGDARLARCLEKARARKKELEASGAYVEIVRQELQFSMYQMSLLMRSSICQSSLVSPR